MAFSIQKKQSARLRRARRTRVRLHGTARRPRLSVSRSLKHIEAQLINDDAGATLCSASDRGMKEKQTKIERAALVGTEIATRALAAGITEIVFDRGAYRFHGRVKAIAEAARAGGLKF